jgi:putative ABC transport system permease protein
VIGRLAPDVSLAQAQAALDTLSRSLAAEFPEENAGWEGAIQPVREWIVGGDIRARLYGMLAAVVLLMLVACTNVANLQIARSSARQRELGVRQALGAARSRLVSHLLAECAVLAVLGGVLGIALAHAAVQAAIAVLPASTPRLAAFAVDWRAAALAIAVSAGTAFAFGVTPALLAMRTQLAAVLQQLGRSGMSARRGPLRQALVVLQFALATLLVCAAAVLAQQLSQLQQASMGFPVEQLLIARITQAQENENIDTTPHQQVHTRVMDEIRALPGVTGVGLSSEIPLGDFNTSMMVAAGAGGPLTYRDSSVQASWRVVSSDYLATLGVPLLRGRGFSGDSESSRSIILSKGLADELFPAGDAVGRTIRLGNGQPRNVIGVAGDVRQVGLGEDPTPTMYMPTTWIVTPTMTLIVRTDGDPAAMIPAVRDAAKRVAPDVPLFDLQSMRSVMGTSVAEPRVQTSVLLAFALASLLLAGFGVAGVVAYLVANRTPELAVRMALGAAPGKLVRQVVRSGIVLCVSGVALGSVLLVVLGSVRDRFVPVSGSATATDPLTVLAVAGAVLLAVGALACWLPARRVARIAPNVALRDGG